MCLLVPGKIVKIAGDIATVDYGSEQRKGTILEGDYRVGDYALIQGQIIVQKVPKEEAQEALKLYNDALGGR